MTRTNREIRQKCLIFGNVSTLTHVIIDNFSHVPFFFASCVLGNWQLPLWWTADRDVGARATLPTSHAIAAQYDDHIVSLSTTGPRSLGRERDPLLGLRDEVGHGLVEDVLLVR